MAGIRYTSRAATRMRQIRERSEEAYHSIRGLIIHLSANPEIDNKSKILKDFGNDSVPVYVDDEWWIVYRVDRSGNEEVFSVLSIWDAKNPPHARL